MVCSTSYSHSMAREIQISLKLPDNPKAHWMEVSQEMRENVYRVSAGSPNLFTSGVEV